MTERGARAIDRPRVDRRLERLEALCDELESTAQLSVGEFLAVADRVVATERRIQVAVQAAIDVAAHVATASVWPVAEGYAATFTILGEHAVLAAPLAERLARAAGLRNLLVHDYLDIDPVRLHRSLTADVADLRAFVHAIVLWLEGPCRSSQVQ